MAEITDEHFSSTELQLVRGLASAVAQLTVELAELRASLAAELRTRRLVIVEDDGFERAVLAARGSFGEVRVVARGEPGRSTAAELFAVDGSDGDAANVGLALTGLGDVVASLDVSPPQPPRWWNDTRAQRTDWSE